MNQPLTVIVRCFPAPLEMRNSGARCFARVVVDMTLSVDGLVVRRTGGGQYQVTWPERRDERGRHHSIVRWLDEVSRKDIEHAVLVEAAKGGWIEVSPREHGGAA